MSLFFRSDPKRSNLTECIANENDSVRFPFSIRILHLKSKIEIIKKRKGYLFQTLRKSAAYDRKKRELILPRSGVGEIFNSHETLSYNIRKRLKTRHRAGGRNLIFHICNEQATNLSSDLRTRRKGNRCSDLKVGCVGGRARRIVEYELNPLMIHAHTFCYLFGTKRRRRQG
ncbi:hypothetical protein BC939DRAFT_447939 [Gamsiella multidivaricata]|uniref:uncharacterized protein n=1 Tax=Gamsiella multidivaricata TaxID=101098 RepID=UPI00221F9B62|nr:uncharacterized protein BC939DRAFT_447939 [Gamsiella multidivaricata]KAI7825654.1 hypothetical protein BC939DRAFT_447939 [Gamsiella multidivaricata]